MNKKILIFAITLLFVLPGISINSVGLSDNRSVLNSNYLDNYLIEDVPYAPQKEFGCAFACIEMIFEYYSKNSSMIKNLFYSGGGYGFAYKREPKSIISPPFARPPYFFKILRSTTLNQGSDDFKFMSSLYGLESKNIFPDFVYNHFKHWNNYWKNVKGILKEDKPILTSIDPCAWPIYLDLFNLTRPLPGRGGHAIVLVGFNEKNRTVCVNDPYPGSMNLSEKGKYRWVDLFDFKRAMVRSFWELRENSYEYFYIENVSETPDFDVAFKLAHNRNIERLKGNISAYDSSFISPQFNEFGVNALKSLRDDYNSLKFYMLIPLLKISAKISGMIDPDNEMPFEYNAGSLKLEGFAQKYISELLIQIKGDLEDENLRNICEYESTLFKNISKNFFELSNLTYDLQNIVSNNSIFKVFTLSKEKLEEIVYVLNEIITIEEQIIKGPEI